MNDSCKSTGAAVSDIVGSLHLQQPSAAKQRGDFKVVLVFDSVASRFRGLDVGRRVQAGFSGEHDLSCSLWRSEMLGNPRLTSIAVQQAVAADLIIVAVEGNAGLPDRVARWLGAWANRPGSRRGALMLVVDERNLDNPNWAGMRRRVADLVANTASDLFTVSHSGPEPDYLNEFVPVIASAQLGDATGPEDVKHRFDKPQPLVG